MLQYLEKKETQKAFFYYFVELFRAEVVDPRFRKIISKIKAGLAGNSHVLLTT